MKNSKISRPGQRSPRGLEAEEETLSGNTN